jgi:hypothetical protein
MWPKLRNLFVTGLFLVGGFAVVFALQTLRGPQDRQTRAAGPEAVESSGLPGAPDAQAGRQTASTLINAESKAGMHSRSPSAPSHSAADRADRRAATAGKDPAARIQRLSNTALTGDSRLERSMAVNALGRMAEEGGDSEQIIAALSQAMGSRDPVVAAQARTLYDRISAPVVAPTINANSDAAAPGANASAASPSNMADQVAAMIANDRAAQIEQLSNTALTGDMRLKRIVAVNQLGAMAADGIEPGQIGPALANAAGSPDPAVAAQARAWYNRMNAGK